MVMFAASAHSVATDSIIDHGLIVGGTCGKRSIRNDIRFAVRPPGHELRSGTRSDCGIVVCVDLARAANDGIEFYRSANDVILSAGMDGVLAAKYFHGIWDIRTGKQLYPLDQRTISCSGGTDRLPVPQHGAMSFGP